MPRSRSARKEGSPTSRATRGRHSGGSPAKKSTRHWRWMRFAALSLHLPFGHFGPLHSNSTSLDRDGGGFLAMARERGEGPLRAPLCPLTPVTPSPRPAQRGGRGRPSAVAGKLAHGHGLRPVTGWTGRTRRLMWTGR